MQLPHGCPANGLRIRPHRWVQVKFLGLQQEVDVKTQQMRNDNLQDWKKQTNRNNFDCRWCNGHLFRCRERRKGAVHGFVASVEVQTVVQLRVSPTRDATCSASEMFVAALVRVSKNDRVCVQMTNTEDFSVRPLWSRTRNQKRTCDGRCVWRLKDVNMSSICPRTEQIPCARRTFSPQNWVPKVGVRCMHECVLYTELYGLITGDCLWYHEKLVPFPLPWQHQKGRAGLYGGGRVSCVVHPEDWGLTQGTGLVSHFVCGRKSPELLATFGLKRYIRWARN